MGTDKIFPDNWKEIINGKKVIFYNTSVGSLLQGRGKHIEKMRWVFQTFQEHPEVVLWWRPHPLELSTIESMAPELVQQYLEMRAQYVDKKTGILDESADVHRAIAVSDAYYGDWSSVVQLYKVAKKPVLFENDNVKTTQAAAFLPGNLCIKDGHVWFLQLNSNKFVRVNKTMSEAEEIISIPMENSFKYRQYNYHMIDLGTRFLLLLENSKNIYEYGIDTQIIRSYPLGTDGFRFHSELVVEWDKKLWMFPYGGNTVLEYDYYKGTTSEKGKMSRNTIKAAKCHELIGTYVYMVNSGSNCVYRYDLSDNSCLEVEVGHKNNQYWGIKKAGDYFVLPHTEQRKITLWNEENGAVLELADFPEQYECLDKIAYLDMFEKNGDMYIIPFYANMILKIDIQKRLIIQGFADAFFTTKSTNDAERFRCEMYLCAKQYNSRIYAYASYCDSWQILDLDFESVRNGPVFRINILEHEKLLSTLLDDGTDDEDSFCEGESSVICTLDNYIRDITKHVSRQCESVAGKESIGARIYSAVINNA